MYQIRVLICTIGTPVPLSVFFLRVHLAFQYIKCYTVRRHTSSVTLSRVQDNERMVFICLWFGEYLGMCHTSHWVCAIYHGIAVTSSLPYDQRPTPSFVANNRDVA
jgi:hypothetical protein